MTDNNVIKLAQPGTFIDSLTEILRSGARALLTQAVEAEVADFLHRHCDLKTEAGLRRGDRRLLARTGIEANLDAAEGRRSNLPAQTTFAQNRPKRTMPLWLRQKVQK